MRYRIKIRLLEIGRTGKELMEEVMKRTGYKIYQPDFSAAVNGKDHSPRAEKILEAADTILLEWENERKKG